VWIPFDVRCTITPDTHTEAGLNCTTTSRLRCCSTVKIYNNSLIISKITRYQQKSTQWKFRTFKRLEVTLIRHQTIRNPTKKNKSKSKIIRFNKDIALISEFTLLVYWKIQKNQTHTKKYEINRRRFQGNTWRIPNFKKRLNLYSFYGNVMKKSVVTRMSLHSDKSFKKAVRWQWKNELL
jgi:hypothetical protein